MVTPLNWARPGKQANPGGPGTSLNKMIGVFFDDLSQTLWSLTYEVCSTAIYSLSSWSYRNALLGVFDVNESFK